MATPKHTTRLGLCILFQIWIGVMFLYLIRSISSGKDKYFDCHRVKGGFECRFCKDRLQKPQRKSCAQEKSCEQTIIELLWSRKENCRAKEAISNYNRI
ncbi:unnamed protein product [Cuscuta epithymum]|uniref:Uncharacterized protein n=1 Tax=Cuscuta epithymum TaxID=186058 RepID=A0AAV0DIH7_9ASTE|nr:unnamed protein product [Cuscuta epithymum]